MAAMAEAAADGGLAVVEGDAVVGEPGAEGVAAAGGDGGGELAFELEELEHAGGEGWHVEGREGEGRTWRRVHGAALCRGVGCGGLAAGWVRRFGRAGRRGW